MSSNHFEARVVKLEKEYKQMKLLNFALIIILLIFVAFIFYQPAKEVNMQNSEINDEQLDHINTSITKLQWLVEFNKSELEKLQEVSTEKQEFQETLSSLISEHNNLRESINKLATPNLFSPWHTYNGHAGIWFIDGENKGKWLPNSYLEEMTFLLDKAIRQGYGEIHKGHRKNTIKIHIHRDELDPGEIIIIDIEKNKIIHRNEYFTVSTEDIELLRTFFTQKGIDGNSR